MNDTVFFKSFRYVEYCFNETQHRDNSRGVDMHFIGFMKHGKGRIVSEGQTLEIHQGEMFYIPKGCRYHSYWIAEDYVQFDSIGFLYFPTKKPNGFMLQKIDQDPLVWAAFAPLSENKALHAASIGTLYCLLGILESILTSAQLTPDLYIYEKMVQYMNEDPHKTIPQYAKLCGASDALLYHHIKKATGKTPNRIRQEILCEQAANLLMTTNYTVEEICEIMKFSSAAYFRKVFHDIYHKAPTQVRKDGALI
jgi:AraC-like DNA-binding protein